MRNRIIIAQFITTWIPVGFAHGLTLTDRAEIIYKTTNFGISVKILRWDDPKISINWPYIKKK